MILDPPTEVRLLLELPGDLIPDPARELARDLFGLLLFLEAAQRQGRTVSGADQDSYRLLRAIRSMAWQGYADPAALTAHVRRASPTSDVARRFALYCDELAAKRSTYLFVPIVTRIDRHQAPNDHGDLDVDRLIASAMVGQTEGDHAAFASLMFALAPDASERFAFQLALILAGPPASGGDVKDRLAGVAQQLRRLADATPEEAFSGIATDIASVARTVSRTAPWLWLEALFIVENWSAGPQFFEHAFEVEMRRADF